MSRLALIVISHLLILGIRAQVVFCPPGAVWKSVFTKGWPVMDPELETVLFTGTTVISGEVVKQELNTNQLANGIYTISFKQNGKIRDKQKLVILKQ